MAAPVVEQVVENSTSTAGANHTITHPTVVANQLWLIVLDKGSTAATVNAHADWTELLDENSANGLYIAYRWTTGGEGASTTLVTSASTRTASFLYRISGAINPSAQAPQIATTSSGSSATPDPPASVTPGSSKDYLFIAFYGAAGEEADDDTWSDTPPTNYTPSPPRQKACGIAGTNLGGLIAAAERALTTGSAEDPGTFAKDVSAAWRAQTIMVHPPTATTVTPTTAALTTATFAPTVTATQNQLVTPDTAALSLATFAPVVSTPQLVTPDVVALTLTTFAPTVTASSGIVATPGTASLSLTSFAPTVSVSDHKSVIPATVALALTGFVPTVSATANVTVTPEMVALLLTVYAPTVTGDAAAPFGGGVRARWPRRRSVPPIENDSESMVLL